MVLKLLNITQNNQSKNWRFRMEKIYWSPYEDSILQLLRQQRKMQRWTDIARALATEFGIKGRNGKHCRDRYQEKFDSSTQTSFWSYDEEKILFSLHNELGNKWAIISRKMNGRSDNCIKNHFYSRLRKGLKKMNQVAEEVLEKRFKQIKFSVLFKIIEATEDGYKNNVFCQVDTSKRCFEIKNKLIVLSYDEEESHDEEPQSIDCVELYNDIIDFNRNYKRKPKKFRRIPTKSYNLKQRQNCYDDIELKSTHSDIESENHQIKNQSVDIDEESNHQEKKQPSIQCDEHEEYDQELYPINENKDQKFKRESNEMNGIEQILCVSGIIEEEPELPLLELIKKGTSFFSMINDDPHRENIFFDEYELNSESFIMKDLMSMKRISHTESRLFD